MDPKKPEGMLFDPENTNRLTKLAKLIAGQQGMDEEKALKLIRRHIYKIVLELEQFGEADAFGIGRLKKDPEGGYVLHHYPEETRKMWDQIQLQQEYGGELGNIGDRPLDEINIEAAFDFPVEAFIGKLAEHTGASFEELKQTFYEQLEQAYNELIENGIGYLPDFGYIRNTGDELSSVEFNLNDEVAGIFKKDEPGEPDDG